MNIKTTHRATTSMREAMEKSVRTMGWKHSTKIAAGLPDNHPAYQISDALHANADVYRRPDVSLNVSFKTIKVCGLAGNQPVLHP